MNWWGGGGRDLHTFFDDSSSIKVSFRNVIVADSLKQPWTVRLRYVHSDVKYTAETCFVC